MSTSRTLYTEDDHADLQALLLGHTLVKVADDTLVLDDGRQLKLVGNDGGCACSAGCYDLTELNGVDNVITKVELVNSPSGDDEDGEGHYKIFVFADNQKINLATFEGSDGNGYYGTGYAIHVVAAPTAIEPTVERPHPTGDGIQRLYRFDNGYGASVVRFLIPSFSTPVGSYGAESGLWELAVLKFTGAGMAPSDWDLTYETPITDDVLGHLDDDEVQGLLLRIRDLPAVSTRGQL